LGRRLQLHRRGERVLKRWWPHSLAGQLVLIALVALLAGQGLSLLIFADERRVAVRAAYREQVLARTAGLARLLADTPAALHDRILRASSGALVRFGEADASAVAPHGAWQQRNPIARQLKGLLDGNAGRAVLVDFPDERPLANLIGFEPRDPDSGRLRFWQRRPHGPPALLVSVELDGGGWLNVESTPPPPPAWALPSLVSLGLSAALVGLGVVLAVRRVTRPMRRLAAAADALGRGEAPTRLAEVGPSEVLGTVAAFNRMQGRLRRFVDDRIRMLAAISHDLRTPITSLRLRAEFVDDEETRARILVTLDEMQDMVEGTLAFAREEAAAEATRVVDLAALIESTAADLADLGASVAFAGPGKTAYACRPVALRRALRNLLENAVRYGGRTRVRLEQQGRELRIVVEDDGPGIPEGQFERVFEPFVRLEDSRSPETGGIGLGLAIARSIVRGHGGDIRLANQAQGGLVVVVTLPSAAHPEAGG
jgi:signal transduction histidine kinase